jgi:hypothetical protein
VDNQTMSIIKTTFFTVCYALATSIDGFFTLYHSYLSQCYIGVSSPGFHD